MKIKTGFLADFLIIEWSEQECFIYYEYYKKVLRPDDLNKFTYDSFEPLYYIFNSCYTVDS